MSIANKRLSNSMWNKWANGAVILTIIVYIKKPIIVYDVFLNPSNITEITAKLKVTILINKVVSIPVNWFTIMAIPPTPPYTICSGTIYAL